MFFSGVRISFRDKDIYNPLIEAANCHQNKNLKTKEVEKKADCLMALDIYLNEH